MKLVRDVVISLVCVERISSMRPLVMKPGGPYETSARPRENMLNVHLVPHTHDDVGWLKTVEELYLGARNDVQMSSVQYILESVIDALEENPDRKFVYVEMAFFSRWWRRLGDSKKAKVVDLLKQGRLEFLNGGWASNDEATPSFVDIIDQHTMGSEFIAKEFGPEFCPTVGWQADPFGHSKFMADAYAQMGMNSWFFGRSDAQDFANRLRTHRLETIHSGILTGSMEGYGPPQGFDWDILSKDDPLNDDEYLGAPNIEERVEKFIGICMQKSEIYNFGSEKTKHVMLTMGSDFEYANAKSWFINMDKLIHYANQDGRVNVFYSTPRIYTESRASQKRSAWEVRSDYDWFPYCDSDETRADDSGKIIKADGRAYWTGYFTSRPFLKRKVREASAMLEHCRIAELRHAQKPDNKDNPAWQLWEALSVVQHHDGVSGTSKARVAWDYYNRLDLGIKKCKDWILDLLPSFYLVNDSEKLHNFVLHSKLVLGSDNLMRTTKSDQIIVKFGYYRSSVGFTEERPDQASGTYIFRPDCPEGSKVAPCRPIEINPNANSDWIKYLVFDNRVEWEIGPIPLEDGVGKEIVIIIEPRNLKIKNDGVFFTDSNAFEWIKRQLNKRKTWEYVVTDPVAGNYYPVVSSIAIVGSGKALVVTSDRSVGGSSLEQNQIEIMLNRVTTRDDARGVNEPLMDSDQNTGNPLVIKGTTYFQIIDAPVNEPPIPVPLDQIRPPVDVGSIPANLAVQLVAKLKSIDLNVEKKHIRVTHFHRVNIPAICPLSQNIFDCLLIRIVYLGSSGDPVELDIGEAIVKADFGKRIIKMTETVLHGGISKEDSVKRKIYWTSNPTTDSIVSPHMRVQSEATITIKPGEIRTVIVQVEVEISSAPSSNNIQTI